jgi:hypothetical protein
MIGDAAKIRLPLFFDEETMFGAVTVLKMWIERYGMPKPLYCDKKNAFVLTREPAGAEILAGIIKPKSHFGKACCRLGVEVIAAGQPAGQRPRGVGQDRLVKVLRLEGVRSVGGASKFLLEIYLPKMNEKFSRPARNGGSSRVNPGKVKTDDILCMEFDRHISKDYIIRFQARLFQIQKINKPLPRTGDKVLVRIKLDNPIHVLWKDKPLQVKEIPAMFDE